MPHPQLENVFGRGSLLDPADVSVHVDKAWQDIHALDIQLLVVGLSLRSALGVDRYAGNAHAPNVDDPVALDNDVHWPDGWCTCAVDQGSTSQDQALERALALGAGRGLGYRLRPVLGD